MTYQVKGGEPIRFAADKQEHYLRLPTERVMKSSRRAAQKALKLAKADLGLPDDTAIGWYHSYPESHVRAQAALERLGDLLGEPGEKVDSFTSPPGSKTAGMVRFDMPSIIWLSAELQDATRVALVTLHEARHVWQIMEGHYNFRASSPWTEEEAEDDADDYAAEAMTRIGKLPIF